MKYIAPYISMIDAVDSLKLLREINKQAAAHNRTIKVLLELHIAEEETKYGLSLDACRQLLEEGDYTRKKKARSGVMSTVSLIYWLSVTAIFLFYTFGPSFSPKVLVRCSI